MELREGNKNSRLGLIPSDWIEYDFEDVLTGFSSGQTPYRAITRYYDGDIPWITSGELNYNIIEDTIEKITGEAVKKTNLKRIPKGTFLMAITGLEAEGTRGSCAITGIEATSNQSCMALFPKSGLITNDYLFQFYLKYGNWLAFNYCQGTKQQSYTARIAKKLPIVLPPTLAEQTAIATVLSDTDELIRSLEQLIKKKKAIKQGMMQELLRPKKGWVVKRLGDICLIRKGQLITDNTRIEGNIPVIAGGKTPAYYHNKPNRTGKTITISGSGASAGFVSFHPYPIFASDCSTIEESANFSIEFLFFVLQLFQEDIYQKQTGGAQPHIHPDDLAPIEIPLPPLSVQQSLAQTLIDIDSEIKAINSKMKKLMDIKQGMMQELLTGKTRLI